MKIKTFKESITLNNDDVKDLRIDRANLDAAAASSIYIEKLKQELDIAQTENFKLKNELLKSKENPE